VNTAVAAYRVNVSWWVLEEWLGSPYTDLAVDDEWVVMDVNGQTEQQGAIQLSNSK
jgi:hypothetical protein